MRHAFANCCQSWRLRLGRLPTQIDDLDFVRRHLFQNLLLTVGPDNGSQHLVAIDDAPPRAVKAFDVRFPARALEFEVAVRGNAAEVKGAAPANPIGVLQIGQRKGCVPVFQISRQVTRRRLR